MNVKKLILAAIVVGIVVNVYDFVIHGVLLAGTYEGLPALFRQDSPILWLVIGGFVAALVFVWYYAKVQGSFGTGAGAGAKFGLYTGILLGFPSQLFLNMMFVDFPYSLSWIWVFAIIGWGIVAGATAGAMYRVDAAPAAPAASEGGEAATAF
ncbi:MAG: hypothetical protein ACE5HF_11430 [Gemmatimonadota bacterium]